MVTLQDLSTLHAVIGFRDTNQLGRLSHRGKFVTVLPVYIRGQDRPSGLQIGSAGIAFWIELKCSTITAIGTTAACESWAREVRCCATTAVGTTVTYKSWAQAIGSDWPISLSMQRYSWQMRTFCASYRTLSGVALVNAIHSPHAAEWLRHFDGTYCTVIADLHRVCIRTTL